MNPDEVAASYDSIASRWAGPGFNRENGIAAHRRALTFVAAPRSAALDVGCGSSGRFHDLLRAEGFDVAGLDLSGEMIRLARRRNPDAVFHHADVRTWAPPRRYAFITAWDSIWHVPLADQPGVFRRLCDVLTPGGVFVFTAGGLEQPGEVRDEAMGVPMYHATLGVPALLRLSEECGCEVRHLEYDHWPELHLVMILRKRPAWNLRTSRHAASPTLAHRGAASAEAPPFPAVKGNARILAVSGGEVFTVYEPDPKAGPVFMQLLEKTFGKDQTTRTWDTVLKCAAA